MPTAREETARLADLLQREHLALAEFLSALATFDRERRWVELGHSSLFNFLVRELGLSKGAAYYRKTAAELIQRHPEVLDALREGKLCLTSIVELSKVVTPENRADVLPRFFHLSKSEAKAVTAELLPAAAPPLRTIVTAPAGAASSAVPTDLASSDLAGDAGSGRHPCALVGPSGTGGEVFQPTSSCQLPPSQMWRLQQRARARSAPRSSR